MLSVLRGLLLVPLAIIASCHALIICLLKPFDPDNARKAAAIYGRYHLPLFGLKVTVEGRENLPQEAPFIVVANHQSNFDLLVMGQAVPPRTVSLGKKSLKWIPLFGQVYWLSGNVMIDRQRGDRARATMDQIQAALTNEGRRIWIFPEGTRNSRDTLLDFKKGAFTTAVNTGVPLIPVCAPRYFRRINWNRWDNGHITVRILPPIVTDTHNRESADALRQDVQQLMQAEIDRLDAEARRAAGEGAT